MKVRNATRNSLEMIKKRIKNFMKQSLADSMVNEFLKYCGIEVTYKLLKIVNVVLELGEVSCHFRGTVIKPLCKEGGKSGYGNYRSVSLVL